MRDSLVVTGPHLHQENLGSLIVTTDQGKQGPLSTLLVQAPAGSSYM